MIYDGFKDWSDVQKQFEMNETEPDEVLLAWYDGGAYEGDSIVIYRRREEFFLNEAYHCSCHGLEGLWEPERYESKELFLKCLKERKFYDAKETIDHLIDTLSGKGE